MRKSSFTEAQRLSILTEQDGDKSIDEICRIHQISSATFYKWKKAQSINEDEEKRRIKELESENAQLKKIYSDLSTSSTWSKPVHDK